MELRNISVKEYKSIFQNPYHIYNKEDFNCLTAELRDVRIDCLGFKSKKYKLGIIGGIIDGKFYSPFSAPFGGFSYTKEDVSLQTIDEAVDLFLDYCRTHCISEIRIISPPVFYSMSFINKLNNVLYRKNFSIAKVDLNYTIHLNGSIEDYMHSLDDNGKRNLSIALASRSLKFDKCESCEDKKLAYKVISDNHKAKGYPMRMTFEAVIRTMNVVDADFFIVSCAGEPAAAAIVFHVSDSIVQVIYWGDLPQYTSYRTMNFLSYNLVEYYHGKGIEIVDLGPSSENSLPNYGLCNFKESIGCKVYTKLSWEYKF